MSQDSGFGDEIDGGECQEIADLFGDDIDGREEKIAEEVTAMENRAFSSCSMLSGGEDAKLELDIFTMCR